MHDRQENQSETAYQRWSHTVAGMLAWQWNLFEIQCDVGFNIADAALRIPNDSVADSEAPSVGPRPADQFPRLETLAFEKVRQGLAPPREIYEAPYRNRIDWLKFPEWARPTDPELFQDCGHEG